MAKSQIYFLSEKGRTPFNEFLKKCAEEYGTGFIAAVSKDTGIPDSSICAYISFYKDGSPQVPPEDRFKKIIGFLGYKSDKFELVNVRGRTRSPGYPKKTENLARKAAEAYIQRGIRNFSTTFFRSLSQEHEKLYHRVGKDFPAFVEYVRGLGYEIHYFPQRQNRKTTKQWSEKEIIIVRDTLRKFSLNGISRKGCLSSIKKALKKIGYERTNASIMYMVDEMRKYKKPNLFERQFSGKQVKERESDLVPPDALDNVLTIREYLELHLHKRIDEFSRKLDKDFAEALSSDRLSGVDDLLNTLGGLTEKYKKKVT